MIYIVPLVYNIGQILTWGIFYCVFNQLFCPKVYPLIVLWIFSSFSQIFLGNWSYFITAILLYLTFEHHPKINFFLINTIILSSLLRLISEFFADTTTIVFYDYHISTKSLFGSISFVLITVIIELALNLCFILTYRYFNLEEHWNIKHSYLFTLLFGYLFIVIYFFMQIIQNYQAYSDLVSGAMLFILIQCAFIVILFLKSDQTQKEAYSRELTKEQLKNLKMYTDQLEHDQINLQKFEHNYKKTISGLRRITQTSDYSEIQKSLTNLESYSDSYFDNISMQLFKDLNNVQNPYLKSLLISKLTLISQKKINCHFECQDVVDKLNINIFDLVRLLGISLDNAIEATAKNKGEIQIALIQESKQLSIIINNTIFSHNDVTKMMQDGFTTKKNHSGFGLVNVADIEKKYPNLFVQYRQNHHWFNLTIVIIK